MKEITLQVRGRKMTFSEEELVSILEKYFETKEVRPKEIEPEEAQPRQAQFRETPLKKDNTKTDEPKQKAKIKVVQTPTEGKWFEVNPMAIDQRLFSKPRDNRQQEETRQHILEAFNEMKKLSQYARPFETMMPVKESGWNVKRVGELEKIACQLGDHMADWVEQALEWAQRIANGETWEDFVISKILQFGLG